MKKIDKILLAASVAVGIADIVLARSVYLKKKGIVLRDMALQSVDRKMHKPIDEEAKAEEIPIE